MRAITVGSNLPAAVVPALDILIVDDGYRCGCGQLSGWSPRQSQSIGRDGPGDGSKLVDRTSSSRSPASNGYNGKGVGGAGFSGKWMD